MKKKVENGGHPLAKMKRFEYWGLVDGRPVKMFTNWFPWNGEKYQWQLKNKLKNEYR